MYPEAHLDSCNREMLICVYTTVVRLPYGHVLLRGTLDVRYSMQAALSDCKFGPIQAIR